MLPRHLQTVGGRYFARASYSQPLRMSGNLPRDPWWTGYYRPSSSFPVNSWPYSYNAGPYHYFGPHRPSLPSSQTLPWFPAQSSWLHLSHFNMDAKGDEPFRKRKKSIDEDEYRPKPWTKRPYPPASDLRVPPMHGTPEAFVPTSPQTEAKAPELKRTWEDFSQNYHDETSSKENFDFTVMSYNILSQELLEDNSSLYSHCRRPYLFWNYRLPNLLRELQEMNADAKPSPEVSGRKLIPSLRIERTRTLSLHMYWDGIWQGIRVSKLTAKAVFTTAPMSPLETPSQFLFEEENVLILCLQEVQEDHYQEQIKPSLEALGYICEYKARTRDKPDGCAICFKSNKFNLKLVKPVEYFRQNIALLDRDNIGLVLMLQPKTKGGESPMICVANTHLLFNPRRGDIKLTQLAILLAEITEAAQIQDRRFYPIVLCGDFNSVPGSPLHRFIKEGMLSYEGMTIGKVSGQEKYYRGQRILSIPIWPRSLGINQRCVYETQEKEQPGNSLEEALKTEQAAEYDNRADSRLQHHFSLSSVYSHYFPDTGMPEITTCHSKSAVTVDYIFYSDVFRHPGFDAHCNGLQLLGRLSLLTEKDLWSVNGLPNETNSSDHLSLLAKFRLQL